MEDLKQIEGTIMIQEKLQINMNKKEGEERVPILDSYFIDRDTASTSLKVKKIID